MEFRREREGQKLEDPSTENGSSGQCLGKFASPALSGAHLLSTSSGFIARA